MASSPRAGTPDQLNVAIANALRDRNPADIPDLEVPPPPHPHPHRPSVPLLTDLTGFDPF